MDKYDIITVPDPALKTRSAPVEDVTDDIRRQMDRMLLTMHEGCGIGLAANQVNILNRVLVMDLGSATWKLGDEEDGVFRLITDHADDPDEPQNPIFMVNPEVIAASEKGSVYTEGCLSVPEQFGDVMGGDPAVLDADIVQPRERGAMGPQIAGAYLQLSGL